MKKILILAFIAISTLTLIKYSQIYSKKNQSIQKTTNEQECRQAIKKFTKKTLTEIRREASTTPLNILKEDIEKMKKHIKKYENIRGVFPFEDILIENITQKLKLVLKLWEYEEKAKREKVAPTP